MVPIQYKGEDVIYEFRDDNKWYKNGREIRHARFPENQAWADLQLDLCNDEKITPTQFIQDIDPKEKKGKTGRIYYPKRVNGKIIIKKTSLLEKIEKEDTGVLKIED